MRYSITSRFRGTLLGATLAQTITQPSQIERTSIAKILIPGTQSLIELGQFDRDNWQEKLLLLELTPLQSIIATLPLILFYHDNQIKLRQHLLSVANIWQNEPIIQESILALGYAIAQALTEKLEPSRLIPQLVTFLGPPATDLPEALIQVQPLLEQKAGIEKTISQIIPNCDRLTASIALAFYYFLITAEDFSLSVKRSRRSPLKISTLVGALSGAYNSAASIPSSWQLDLVDSQTSAETEMLQLLDPLIAVWSGAYNPNQKLTATAVAAPHVIR
jgi:hypothetical protein